MGFDFFKKKGKDGRPPADDLEFDDLERSGEFLSTGGEAPDYPPPPRQEPPRTPPYSPPAPSYAPPPPPRPAAPVRPPDLADDITIVNAPAVPSAPRPAPPAPPPVAPAQAAPRPPAAPGPPAPPGPPRPPAPPQAAAPPPPVQTRPPAAPPAPPPFPAPGPTPRGTSDDEVTQVLNTPVASQALVAWLVIALGDQRGKDFRLPCGTVRLGQSSACEIQLPRDTFVSTQHAELCFRGSAFWLKDLNSTNGTFVNGVQVSEVTLKDGDRVKVGMTEMIFKSLKL